MKTAIIVFDGSNRQDDLAHAINLAVGRPPAMVPALETALPAGVEVVFLPGGFSYGDYLRSGAMAAKTPAMRAVKDFAARGGRVLGICNGFQILCEAGLLRGLLRPNAGGRFVCRWQGLKPSPTFAKMFGGGRVTIPIAHGDGNFQATADDIKKLQDGDQVVAYYDGNPNGSAHGIAAICNDQRNVFGMMPHPENAVEDFQRSLPMGPLAGATNPTPARDGLVFFKNFLASLL